jgi:hypothetical protein
MEDGPVFLQVFFNLTAYSEWGSFQGCVVGDKCFFYHWLEVIAILHNMRTVKVGAVLLELCYSFRVKHAYRRHHYIL